METKDQILVQVFPSVCPIEASPLSLLPFLFQMNQVWKILKGHSIYKSELNNDQLMITNSLYLNTPVQEWLFLQEKLNANWLSYFKLEDCWIF